MPEIYFVSHRYPPASAGRCPTTELAVQAGRGARIQTILTVTGTGRSQDRTVAGALLERATGERPDASTVTRFLDDRPGRSSARITPEDLEAFLGQRELPLTAGASHA